VDHEGLRTSFSQQFIRLARQVLPLPFTIAILLTFLTIGLAIVLTGSGMGTGEKMAATVYAWSNGLGNSGGLVFAMQMMLMLVLGHVLALTKPIDRLIIFLVRYCDTTANAAFMVTALTIMVALFNWGLGLVFGAIFARKVAEYATERNTPLNYPLIGAAGYSGLLVWHGGLSGSAPIKVADPGHFLENEIGRIFFSDTVFSGMNLSISLALLLVLPAAMYILGRRLRPAPISLRPVLVSEEQAEAPVGAERLDRAKWLAWLFAGLVLVAAVQQARITIGETGNLYSFITPNFVNMVLLGLAILLHQSFFRFLRAVDHAIAGATGILVQFPLYFGIMGIMIGSGLVEKMSAFFVANSTETTFPILTFLSAGIVNVFVPSGGGQWAVQGPVIVDAANQLGVPLSKSIMAMAYGDQLTNMVQPFWALPLLGITGLAAKDILPYTLYLMVIGALIFITGLLVF
jgi:short-chain fatty acids transporter